MRSLKPLLILSILYLLSACNNESEIAEEFTQLVMGDTTSDNIISADLPAPITTALNLVHSSPRPISLNFDLTFDVTLLAYQSFNGDKGLTISTNDINVRISVNADGDVQPLNAGDIVTATSENWVNADNLPLAVLTGQSVTGLWNNLDNKYLAVRIDTLGRRFLGWIELSLSEYDNYTFHNFVIKEIP